jgi:hypothetical protein
MILPSGIWKHWRGGFYQVIGVGQHTETKEHMVVYVSLTGAHLPGPRVRVRPLTGPEGFMVPPEGHEWRFKYIGNEIPAEDRKLWLELMRHTEVTG